VEVNGHLREIFNYWAPTARQKSISYELEPADESLPVAVEPLDLRHIVSNLIENALKFTPEHGRVVVSAVPCFRERRKAHSHLLFNMERNTNQKTKNSVCITVSDTGPGIAPEHHEHIFGDFVQLPQTSSRGMGLGLALK
jgi:signal transduction histidine kinase